MGQKTDTAGNLVESTTDEPKYFALLFEFTGDKKAVRHCLYYCKATRPTTEGQTKGDGVEVATEEIEFTAIPLPEKNVIKRRSTPESTNYESWYTTVDVPTFE